MMAIFPPLMYYFWICLWFYDGALVHPNGFDDIVPFIGRMWNHVKQVSSPAVAFQVDFVDATVGRGA